MMIVILSLLFSHSLLSATYENFLADGIAKIENISSTSAMNQINVIDSHVSKQCLNKYRRIYSDEVLNISIGFGYFDHNYPNSYVHDVAMKAAFIKAISSPCPPNLIACGLEQDSEDPDKFYKEVINPWGRSHRVELVLSSGSFSDDNDVNILKRNKGTQDDLCRKATNRFMETVKRGDEVVLYVGHSREGGGPDFCPPRLMTNGRRDYTYYRSEKPGHNRMLKALDEAKTRGESQEIIGMLSCNSIKHFLPAYVSRTKSTGFIMSQSDTLSKDQLVNLYGALNSVLAQNCVEGFVPSVGAGKTLKLFNVFNEDIK